VNTHRALREGLNIDADMDCVVLDASLTVDGTPVLDAGRFLL